jgi:hypothetical protein
MTVQNEPTAPSSPMPSWAIGVAEPGEVIGAIPATKADVGISPIFVGGDADPGGRDTVAGTVAGAVANAQARFREHESDTHVAGTSTIGDLMTLPPVPEEAATDDPSI